MATKIRCMNKDKTLITCSLDEFLEAISEKIDQMIAGYQEEPHNKKNLVYGLAGLSQLLGCSISTAARIKKSGVLDPAIRQTGKIIVVDADLALDLMKIKRRRKRF